MLQRFFIGFFLLLAMHASATVRVQNLRCEGLENPLGIDVLHPRLTWLIIDAKRNTVQDAYQTGVLIETRSRRIRKCPIHFATTYTPL